MRRPVVAALAAATLLLGGCADDGEPEGDPAPTPAPSTSEPSTGEPSQAESSSPTAPPATGPTHETSVFTIRGATADYVSREVSGDRITALSDLRVGDNVYFSVKPDYDDVTLEELTAQYDAAATYVGDLERQPDTEVAGEPAVHLSGKMSRTRYAEVYLMLREGTVVEIDFEMLSEEPERSQVVASMLATFAWK